MSISPESYGPRVAPLVAAIGTNELGPGRPNSSFRPQLAELSPETLAEPHPLADRRMALAAIAGLWLRHDFLDESHRISQDVETTTGSYWHGIMHRREPDYGNAKYWFRRVGSHPVFAQLAVDVPRIVDAAGARSAAHAWIDGTTWDPFAFVDACQRAAQGASELHSLCMEIQRREWELLFDYSYRQAIGQS